MSFVQGRQPSVAHHGSLCLLELFVHWMMIAVWCLELYVRVCLSCHGLCCVVMIAWTYGVQSAL